MDGRQVAIQRRGSRVVYESPWMKVREDEIEYSDGRTGTYSLVDKADFALVIPFENDGFWLVEQYRYPLGLRCWEFPQGAWPPGRTPGTCDELAAAELVEETGLRARNWQHLGRVFAACGYSGQAFDVFVASGLTAGEPDREPSEQDMVHRWFGDAEVRRMIADGELRDSHTLAALCLFDLSRRPGPASL